MDELKREIKTMERELQHARQLAEKNQAALSALDEQRSEREGRLTLALRAQQDYERRLEEKRAELARAEAEAALEAFAAMHDNGCYVKLRHEGFDDGSTPAASVLDQKNSPSRSPFRPPFSLTFPLRVLPSNSASTYSGSVLGARRNLGALPTAGSRASKHVEAAICGNSIIHISTAGRAACG